MSLQRPGAIKQHKPNQPKENLQKYGTVTDFILVSWKKHLHRFYNGIISTS